MSLREFSCPDLNTVRQYAPLKLAHLGDTVWEMMVRSRLCIQGKNVHNMHVLAVAGVNAHAQAVALEQMLPVLTEEEADIVRRGRNAHPHHSGPKNQNPADYQAATGLEALMGFLYLTGQDQRIVNLFHIACGNLEEKYAGNKTED